jgi:general secretion pathway protein G
MLCRALQSYRKSKPMVYSLIRATSPYLDGHGEYDKVWTSAWYCDAAAKAEAQIERLRKKHQRRCFAGFTLLELMVVMTLILIVASISVPIYTTAIRRAKEAVLRDDLYTMRHIIDEYTADKQQPPQALQDLVDAGYLRSVPVYPLTGSSDTWKPDVEEVPMAQGAEAGIVDVHSGAEGTSLEGTAYGTW